MAFKKITFACAALVLLAFVNAEDTTASTETKLKCYQCPDGCDDYSDKEAEECPGELKKDEQCYIKELDGKWERGCTGGVEKFCGDLADDKCSVCETEWCNSATSAVPSLFWCAMAYILIKLHN